MFFNSLTYIIFLPIVAIILFILPKKYQWVWILICSIFFYYTILPYYLILFLVLVFINYYLGIAIENAESKKKSVFIISIIINLIFLALFKYFGFIEKFLQDLIKLSENESFLKIILPIGFSYFIFTILSYLIELKRGKITAERNIGIFTTALLFFPKILKGPIERPEKIFHQFREKKKFDYNRIVDGLKQILWGYFKKLVIADRLAIYVNTVYGNHEQHSGITLIVATIFYSFQIYADFSGYTDIAIGSAKILGFDLSINFKRPYFATSIKEFWNRWHISFSTWLRDYLFLPTAYFLSRKMKKNKYLKIVAEKWIFLFASFITFAICGIWHGEGSNFLFWGLLFGFYLTFANWTLKFSKKIRKFIHVSKKSILFKAYSIIITFVLVSFAWIFFKANTTQDAIFIIKKLFTIKGHLFLGSPAIFIYSVFGIFLLIISEYNEEFLDKKYTLFYHKNEFVRILSYASVIILILLIGVFDGGQFIYFQF